MEEEYLTGAAEERGRTVRVPAGSERRWLPCSAPERKTSRGRRSPPLSGRSVGGTRPNSGGTTDLYQFALSLDGLRAFFVGLRRDAACIQNNIGGIP